MRINWWRRRRALAIRVAGDPRFIAVEDAARFRDALGVPLPVGVPESLLAAGARSARRPRAALRADARAVHRRRIRRRDTGSRRAAAEAVLLRLTGEGRLIEGEFRPGGTRREWTDAGVLRMLRRRSLARLRHEVGAGRAGRSSAGSRTTWQGIVKRRQGADALLDAIEQLQGAPLPASILETEILPARIDVYDPADLDAVTAAGEVIWVGVEALGERDGRIALYLADHLPRLLAPDTTKVRLTPRRPAADEAGPQADREISETARSRSSNISRDRGASFFAPILEAAGGGFPAETVDALWNLVWRGLATNDTFHALRAFTRIARATAKGQAPPSGRSLVLPFAPPRAAVGAKAGGRWSAARRQRARLSAARARDIAIPRNGPRP